MIEKLAEQLDKVFSPQIATILIATLPISELRGALPIAINLFRLPVREAFLLSVFGNILPVLPILWLLDILSQKLSKYKWGKKFFEWLFTRTRKRSKLVERYYAIGLVMFVAIPLPFTGAWTGCVAARLFDIPFKYALPAIVIGVTIAGVVVLTINFGVVSILKFFSVSSSLCDL